MFIGIDWGKELAYDNNGGYTGNLDKIIPAWSLHRLVEIGFHKGIGIVVANNAYDSIISLIEKRIKNGVFNKEYLNENI